MYKKIKYYQTILNFHMFLSPKEKASKQSNDEAKPGPQASNVTKNEQKQTQAKEKSTNPFFCLCGKQYGSLAAVHTHIKNKHQERQQLYKSQIKHQGKIAANSIRLKDINYNEKQAELMCLADISLKIIYDLYCNVEKNIKDNDILISVNEDLSDDSDIEIQSVEGEKVAATDSARRREMNESFKRLQEKYKISKIIGENKQDKELESFRLQKFKLNILTQLSKFFLPKYAAKIQFSLYLIHAYEKTRTEELKSHINTILDEIWQINRDIKTQLFKYYREWNRIRYQG